MPIYEYTCAGCGADFEVVQVGGQQPDACPECGSSETTRLLSPTSSSTGRPGQAFPGKGDHGCCGGNPGDRGCTPGSCCGKG